MIHPPLDLLNPVPFDGTMATQLTIGNLGSAKVEARLAKASRIRRQRKSLIVGVAAATECPEALIASLSTVDLVRAGDWVAKAFEAESERLQRCLR